MATDNNAKAKPEPWYPFNSGPPQDKAQLAAGADGQRPKPEPWYPFEAGRPKAQPEVSPAATAKVEAAAAAPAPAQATAPKASPSPATATAAAPTDFKRDISAFAGAQAQPDIIERIKPQADVIRPSWEPSKPLMEPQKVALSSPAPEVVKVAKMEPPANIPVAARVHVHPPTPPRSAFGEKLHAEAKEMNRANGVIGSALAQGLAPDAIKAVVENRLHGHAREIANNVLAGAADAQGVAANLGDSQKVASALQAAASKAINAVHAETIVSSRLKGEAATAGVSAVQALAGPTPTVTISEQQLAAATTPAAAVAFALPEVKAAGQMEAPSATALASQASPEPAVTPAPASAVVSEQPQVAVQAAPEPVAAPAAATPPVVEQPQLASVEPSGVVTYPVPMPESQPLSMTETLASNPQAPVSKAEFEAAIAAAGLEAAVYPTSSAPERFDSAMVQAAGSQVAAEGSAKLADVVSGVGVMSSNVADTTLAQAAAVVSASQATLAEVTGTGTTNPAKVEVVIEERSTLAAVTGPTKTEVAVEERSTQASLADAAAASAAGASSTFSGLVGAKLADAFSASSPVKTEVSVEDRSIQASPADATAALSAKAATEMAQNSYSGLVGAKLAETFASDSQVKANVAVEDRSTQASPADAAAALSAKAATELAQNSYSGGVGAKLADVFSAGAAKPEVVVEDRSVKASAADIAAMTAKADAPSSYSSTVSDKIRDAFSVAANISDTVSGVVKSGMEKGEASLKGAADSVAQVIQTASAAGAKVSLEDALASHMQTKGFDTQSIAAAGEIAQLIREDLRQGPQPAGSVLVLHKDGADLASVVQARDLPAIARPGDSVLAMDTLEKVADKGMDTGPIKEVRGSMPEALKNSTDLELAQSVGPAKSAIQGFEQAQSPEQAAQKQEKSAAVEQSRDAAAAMSMG